METHTEPAAALHHLQLEQVREQCKKCASTVDVMQVQVQH